MLDFLAPDKIARRKRRPEGQGVPAGNTGQEQTKASMQKMADIMAKEKATLWINHDKAQRDSLKMSPEFYE